jgi:hypothetical protein
MKRLAIALLLIALGTVVSFGVASADPDTSQTSIDSVQAG